MPGEGAAGGGGRMGGEGLRGAIPYCVWSGCEVGLPFYSFSSSVLPIS